MLGARGDFLRDINGATDATTTQCLDTPFEGSNALQERLMVRAVWVVFPPQASHALWNSYVLHKVWASNF